MIIGIHGELERQIFLGFPLEPWFGEVYRCGEDCTLCFGDAIRDTESCAFSIAELGNFTAWNRKS
jgi:hypothetical protein